MAQQGQPYQPGRPPGRGHPAWLAGPPVTLRATQDSDLGWVIDQESRPEFSAMVLRWSRERHVAALADPDIRCCIIAIDADPAAGRPAQDRLGFMVLGGLTSDAASIELSRMAVVDPGQGLGARAMEAVKALAFDTLGANRLWLDVFDDNARARRVYSRAGFVEEGLLREAVRRPDGSIGSLVVMSMLRREWTPPPPAAADR